LKFSKVLAASTLGISILVAGGVTNTSAAMKQDSTTQKSEYKVVETHNEIKDLNKLFTRAQKGISDVNASTQKTLGKYSSSSIADNTSKDNGLNFKKYNTAQLLEVKKNAEGKKIETYAVTTMEVAQTQKQDVKSQKTFTALSDGSKADSGWDRTYGVKAYSTVYFNNEYDPRGQKHWDMVKVTGGWKITDDRYTLSDMKVVYGQNGWTYWGGNVSGQTQTKYPKGKTYSYTVPAKWKPVVGSGSFSIGGSGVGTNSKVKIHKSGSKPWTHPFTNNLGS